MTKARDIASAIPAPSTVSSAELGYLDGVTSAIQTQVDSKIGSASAINPTIVDAKGDIIAATAADTVARLAVGSNNTVLTADSSEATGLKWATPAGGKVLQVVMGTTSTQTSITSTTMTDTDLSVAITPSSATSKVLILVSQQFEISKGNAVPNAGWRLMRGATEIFDGSGDAAQALGFYMTASSTETYVRTYASIVYLDSPSTTSATTYKTQARVEASGSSPYVIAQRQTCQSSIIALEIGA